MPPGFDMDLDTLLTVGQAARYLGMSRQRVNRWYELGRLEPAETRDGVRFYRLGDVLEAECVTRNSPFSNRRPRSSGA